MPINFPGTPFNQAVKASKFIRRELHDIIKQRKIQVKERRGSPIHDLLTDMLNDPDGKGVFANEQDATSKISAMLLASYDALGRALTFLVKFLAEPPHVYEKVLKGTDGSFNYIRKLIYHN